MVDELAKLKAELEKERARSARLQDQVSGLRVKLDGIEASSDGIWDWYIKTGEDFLSPRWKRALGYGDELPDTVESWQNLLAEGELERAYAAVNRHFEEGAPYEIVLSYKKKNGEIVPMLSRGKAFKDDKGEWDRMVGVHIDVSHLHKLECELSSTSRELDKAEELYRVLYHQSPDMYCSIDSQGCLKECNTTLVRRLKSSREELLGRSILEFYDPCCHQAAKAAFREFLESGKVRNAELVLRATDGTLIPALLNANGVYNSEGEIIHSVSCLRDISDVKKLEAELGNMARNIEDRIQKRTRVLEHTNRELEQFAYMASHDLQEPVRTIRSFVQIIQEDLGGGISEETQKHLKFVEKGAARMSNLVHDLLTLAKFGKTELVCESIDPREIFDEILEDLTDRIERTNAELCIDVEEGTRLYADPSQLRQALQNLVSNAIKFSGDRVPQIRIRITKQEGESKVEVKDHGIGIAPKFQKQIFDAFKRLHNKATYEGTGIGLAIVARVAANHGGRVTVDSTPGEGSCFTLCLPLQPEMKLSESA